MIRVGKEDVVHSPSTLFSDVLFIVLIVFYFVMKKRLCIVFSKKEFVIMMPYHIRYNAMQQPEPAKNKIWSAVYRHIRKGADNMRQTITFVTLRRFSFFVLKIAFIVSVIDGTKIRPPGHP
jgi:hypothetical protein